jgi:hypothetical protein
LREHGLNPALPMQELLSTRIGASFGLTPISGIAAIAFTLDESRRRRVAHRCLSRGRELRAAAVLGDARGVSRGASHEETGVE